MIIFVKVFWLMVCTFHYIFLHMFAMHILTLLSMTCAFLWTWQALGYFTRMINDFSVFPSDASEGQVGSYWYHEDTQAFFDDLDHYKMIKAMCKLSCSVCDKHGEEQGNDGIKRRSKFKSIEQLKSHLFHRHRLLMCSLCLEGRKVWLVYQLKHNDFGWHMIFLILIHTRSLSQIQKPATYSILLVLDFKRESTSATVYFILYRLIQMIVLSCWYMKM